MAKKADPMEISRRMHEVDCDWVYNFKLTNMVSFSNLNGSKSIAFETEHLKGKDYLSGFRLTLTKKRDPDAYWSAMEIAKRLTNLISVLAGEYVSAKMETFEVITNI